MAANAAAAVWCTEVNAAVHSEICAVPAERLVIEREPLAALPSLRAGVGRLVIRKVDRSSCVRFGSARYSVPTRFIGSQVGLRTDAGRCDRKPWQKKGFCALGPVAEAVITGAAAGGNIRLGPELAELNIPRAAHGGEAFPDARGGAVAFGRWRAADVRSILAAGAGTPEPRPAGDALVLELPVVPVRSLADYAIGGRPGADHERDYGG